MNLSKATTLRRALLLGATTVVITLLCLYSVFMETDYGKALFLTYEEVWNSAERQEAEGNVREAERLLRRIAVLEENRVTVKFGLFVLFAGPDYLVAAKLKLAKMYWGQKRLRDADEMYRDAIDRIVDITGGKSWTYPIAQFRYAEFLAATGRKATARDHLLLSHDAARAILDKVYYPWQDYEGSYRKLEQVRQLLPAIAELQAQLAGAKS